MKPCESEFLTLRGQRMHVRCWQNNPALPLLVMLHGWGDVSATWQFVVDEISPHWRFIAPDWRGFGLSAWNNGSYWFPDYVADLDALLNHYSPTRPVNLVAHSMGGNVACLYAGLRPERVAGLVTLEGFGLPARRVAEAPSRYARWLAQAGAVNAPSATQGFRPYADWAALAGRLAADNPRLTSGQAAFLATHLGVEKVDGRGASLIHLAIDPCHRWTSPLPYSLPDAMAIWRQVRAPVLWLRGAESAFVRSLMTHEADGADAYQVRMACFQQLREVVIPEAGHNMHHDQPQKVAQLIDGFFTHLTIFPDESTQR